ncbi:hypothetical protein BP5796_05376 [Coleophoma crateriformis]|uniref:Uncharacterized protein n=1 Tax=Coleophoma crateriformis TaxID=565419 RepID=A0A3D8S334_9HELO|nr:hypothetical protein BP5796_05376 [Coleophoma crateriformis]
MGQSVTVLVPPESDVAGTLHEQNATSMNGDNPEANGDAVEDQENELATEELTARNLAKIEAQRATTIAASHAYSSFYSSNIFLYSSYKISSRNQYPS